jgi:hypothetical protein
MKTRHALLGQGRLHQDRDVLADHPHGRAQGKGLGCVECHSKDGRLAGIKGIYIPGRDNNKLVDTAGWIRRFPDAVRRHRHGVLRIVTAPQALRRTENG